MSFGRRSEGAPVIPDRDMSSAQPAAKLRESVVNFSDASSSIADPAIAEVDQQSLADAIVAHFTEGDGAEQIADASRGDVATMTAQAAVKIHGRVFRALNPIEQRDLVTRVVNRIYVMPEREPAPEPAGVPDVEYTIEDLQAEKRQVPKVVEDARRKVQPELVERIDVSTAVTLPREELEVQVSDIVIEILHEEKLQLNQFEQRDLVKVLLDEMLGLGPLEPLLADEEVTDIMVNGYNQIYVERRGKLELTDTAFRDNKHVMNIATRIVSQIGRRVDETSPLVDARLADGSRVNIIIPPLAIDGPSISIRKFAKRKITLDVMEAQNNLSTPMAKVLRIASRAQLNILISGGTGSARQHCSTRSHR